MRQWKFRKDTAIRLVKDSWPLIFSGVVFSIYMKIDQVMIKEMLNTETVGIYAVAVNLCEIWYVVPTIIVGSVFPAIIHARGRDYKAYLGALQKLHDLFFLLSVLVGIFISVYSDEIIRLLYGEGFKGAGIIWAIYVWSGVFVFQGTIRGRFLVLENQQHLGLWFRIFSMLANVGLNLLLIPRYGAVGAALATLISYGLPTYVSSLFHPVLRLNLLMCLKSFIFPLRLILYRGGIYR
jgi:O-antigen/teichoic acid export membrane protein